MRTVRVSVVVLVTIVTAAVIWAVTQAWASHCGGSTGRSCTEDIRNTKHNLAANTDILSTGTTEVCVFCHTPHGGRTDVGGSTNVPATGLAPLWNRTLPPQNGFTMYDSPNFDKQLNGAIDGPKGISLACLSCHDGTIAFDALINAPGSGGYNPANKVSQTGTNPGAHIDTMTFNGPGVDSDKSMKEGDRPAQGPSNDPERGYRGGRNDFVFDQGGTGGMEPFPNLGRDLRNDHPISIKMPQGAVDPQFNDARSNSTRVIGGIRPVQRLGYALPIDKRDQVRLYSTDGDPEVDWVECASCHNPHTPRTTFLRLPATPPGLVAPGNGDGVMPVSTSRDLNHEPNQGSLICLTCHQK